MAAPQVPLRGESGDYATADDLIKAILKKLQANRAELTKAKYGNIKFRKDKGKIEVELTTTI